MSGSFLAQLCLNYQGPFAKSKFRRLKTKRLIRLSVYVERKNVCNWSLVYCGKWEVTLKLFVDPIFFNILSSKIFFYSGMVTREVKRGKQDFQDGATGRNAIKGQERKGN